MASPNKTRVQVATDPAFSNVVHDVEGAYTTALQIAEEVLPQGVNLYARGMHGHPITGDSSWSSTVQFKIVVAWEDWDGSSNGASFIFSGTPWATHDIAHMYDDIFVVSMMHSDYYIHLHVLRVTGTVIELLSTTKTVYTYGYTPRIAVVNTNKAVVSYSYSNYGINAFAFKVNEDYSVTIGSAVNILYNARIVAMPECIKIDTDRFVAYMYHDQNSWTGYLWVGSVSDSLVISLVTATNTSIQNTRPNLCILDTNKFLTVSKTNAHNLYATVRILSGSTVNSGSGVYLAAISDTCVCPIQLATNKALVLYMYGNTIYGRILSVVDTVITISAVFTICTNAHMGRPQAIKVDENIVLVQYTSLDNNTKICKLNIEDDVISRLGLQEDDITIDSPITAQYDYKQSFCSIDSNRVLLMHATSTPVSVKVMVLSR